MQLVLNGKKMNCPCDHLEDLKAAYGSGQEITIVNGFATTENLALKEGDEIYFIPKDRLPPKEALEGMMCSRHTPKVHQKVSAGRVAICGLGGLGSNAAVYLARTGVGHLHLIRQSYMVRDLGQRKTDALARQIADINPFIDVRMDFVRLTEDNVPTILKDDQVICEAFDNPDAKTMLVHTILEQCRVWPATATATPSKQKKSPATSTSAATRQGTPNPAAASWLPESPSAPATKPI